MREIVSPEVAGIGRVDVETANANGPARAANGELSAAEAGTRPAMLNLSKPRATAKWRNWQTHQTQNLAHFTVRVGSTPTFATKP